MSWEQRKAIGDHHEQRVTKELEKRGWVAAPYGQVNLRPMVRTAVSRSASPLKYDPDMLATRNGDVLSIDCKDRMPSTDSNRYSVDRDCLDAGLRLSATYGIPLFYVFGDLGVLTPWEVRSYGRLGPFAHNGSYYLVDARCAHNFDHIFGSPFTQVAVA